MAECGDNETRASAGSSSVEQSSDSRDDTAPVKTAADDVATADEELTNEQGLGEKGETENGRQLMEVPLNGAEDDSQNEHNVESEGGGGDVERVNLEDQNRLIINDSTGQTTLDGDKEVVTSPTAAVPPSLKSDLLVKAGISLEKEREDVVVTRERIVAEKENGHEEEEEVVEEDITASIVEQDRISSRKQVRFSDHIVELSHEADTSEEDKETSIEDKETTIEEQQLRQEQEVS